MQLCLIICINLYYSFSKATHIKKEYLRQWDTSLVCRMCLHLVTRAVSETGLFV